MTTAALNQARPQTVAVIATVKNEVRTIGPMLDALLAQTRRPDEIIVMDGGSSDGTVELVNEYSLRNDREDASKPVIRLIDSSASPLNDHCNIACGRNIATAAATSEIIATTDAGCLAEPDWLENLIAPFEADPTTEFVAGVYRLDPQTLFEQVVGLATMRGQLDPFDEKTFNPSARSLAYRKLLWKRIGGWPQWLRYSEDTLFDQKVRAIGAVWRHAGDAVVHWRPRTSYRKLARQFFNYGTGRGHTQIDASSFRYNLRNLTLTAGAAVASFFSPWCIVVLACCLGYFYVWAHHGKAGRIARVTGQPFAYLTCLAVMWVVAMSHLAGYLAGSWQRWRHREAFLEPIEAYMASATAS